MHKMALMLSFYASFERERNQQPDCDRKQV
jgi:hypothetical protein